MMYSRYRDFIIHEIQIPSITYDVIIEILDPECVLCHVTGVQNENKNALINPPFWIFPRSVVYKMSWDEFNLRYSFMLRSRNQTTNQIPRSYKNDAFDWPFDLVIVT